MAGVRETVHLLGALLLLNHCLAGELKVSMAMKDLSARGTVAHHSCSKAAFTNCENRFQGHVEAVAAFNNDSPSDKQDLWCQVLSSHKECMDDVLDNCIVDYPKLSSKIRKFLEEVVHKGCTHEGPTTVDIGKSCVHSSSRKKRSVDSKTQNLYRLANECLKSNGKLDPMLQSLMDLLHNLNRTRQHLYKRLPDV